MPVRDVSLGAAPSGRPSVKRLHLGVGSAFIKKHQLLRRNAENHFSKPVLTLFLDVGAVLLFRPSNVATAL